MPDREAAGAALRQAGHGFDDQVDVALARKLGREDLPDPPGGLAGQLREARAPQTMTRDERAEIPAVPAGG